MPPLARGDAAARLLERLARARRPLLFLDLDGTLAPLVEDPHAARIPERTRRTVQDLRAGGATVVLVTGRSVPRALRVAATPVDAIIGDHGGRILLDGRLRDWLPTDGQAFERQAARAIRALRGMPGVRVERKERSLAVHLRPPASRGEATIRRLMPVLRGLGFRVLNGHRVLDAQLPGINKGRAVRRWLARHPAHDAVLYAGDDTTDEDAMRALRGQALSVAVGPRPRAPDFRTRDPLTFARWLARLARARRPA